MSYQAKWTVSGTKIDDSAAALRQAVQSVSSTKSLKKYESRLNKSFQENIRTNLRRSGAEADSFDDVFFMRIANGQISFINTEPLVTQRYEYGYYNGSNDTNEEYYEEYMVQTSPRYFIRPAIQETLDEIGQLMIQETNEEYMKNRRQSNGDEI
jgi:hypothetical protein